jgi:alpha-L-fucosidase
VSIVPRSAEIELEPAESSENNNMARTQSFGPPFARAALACFVASVVWSSQAPAQTRYTESWSSLDAHDPAPEWFQDAKFGIYYHWGAFGTAMFGMEWYPRNMMNKAGNSAEYRHHMDTYGDPYGDWGYDKFLIGANDKSGKFTQFAPKLKSEGGAWDPDEWAQMFYDAGARFAGPVAEHHDGFSMWDSKVNEWNSADMGPKLNLAKLHAEAIRKKGLKLFMSLHHQWNFGGYWAYGTPSTNDPSLQKLYGKLPNAEEQTLWLNKLKEVIDEFLPDILYQDRYLGQISEANRLAFLAYYYNAALDAGKDVVAVAKESITDHKGQLYDYERGGPADIRTPYWMTDDSVSSQSWSYVTNMPYYADAEFIGSFIDRVSKGGNMILNVSPMPDGTFPQRQKDIMAAFGKFLKQMGTAIYNTRAWVVYGEGPTKMGGGEFASPTALKVNDVRYTKSKDGDAVYSILGGWAGNGAVVNLTSVTTSRFALGTGKVFLFGPVGGSAIELQATQDGSGLHVTLPSTQPYTAIAYAMKISKSGTVPEPTPTIDPGPDGTGGAGGTGGTGPIGGAGGSAGNVPSGGVTLGGAGGTRGGFGGRSGGVGGVALTGGTAPTGGGAPLGGVSSGGAPPTTGGASTGGSAVATGGMAPATGGSTLGPSGGTTTTQTGGAAVQTNAGSSPTGVGGATATQSGGATDSGGGPAHVDGESAESGCGCRQARSASNSGALLALLGLGGLGLRRSRTRRG